jgi:hypothetical protein
VNRRKKFGIAHQVSPTRRCRPMAMARSLRPDERSTLGPSQPGLACRNLAAADTIHHGQ